MCECYVVCLVVAAVEVIVQKGTAVASGEDLTRSDLFVPQCILLLNNIPRRSGVSVIVAAGVTSFLGFPRRNGERTSNRSSKVWFTNENVPNMLTNIEGSRYFPYPGGLQEQRCLEFESGGNTRSTMIQHIAISALIGDLTCGNPDRSCSRSSDRNLSQEWSNNVDISEVRFGTLVSTVVSGSGLERRCDFTTPSREQVEEKLPGRLFGCLSV